MPSCASHKVLKFLVAVVPISQESYVADQSLVSVRMSCLVNEQTPLTPLPPISGLHCAQKPSVVPEAALDLLLQEDSEFTVVSNQHRSS